MRKTCPDKSPTGKGRNIINIHFIPILGFPGAEKKRRAMEENPVVRGKGPSVEGARRNIARSLPGRLRGSIGDGARLPRERGRRTDRPCGGPSWTCAGKPYAAGARRHGWPTRPARGCAWRDKSRPGRTARVPAEDGTGTVEPTVSAGGRMADAFRGKAGEETLRRSHVGHKDEESRVSESGDRLKPSERCVLNDRTAPKIKYNADGGHREVKTFQMAGTGLKIEFQRFRGVVAEQRSPQGRKSGIYRSLQRRNLQNSAVWILQAVGFKTIQTFSKKSVFRKGAALSLGWENAR